MPRAAALVVLTLVLASLPLTGTASDQLRVTFHPARLQVGAVGWVHVRDASETAVVEASVGGRPLMFFPYAGGQAALIGIDLDQKPGTEPWRVSVLLPGQEPRTAKGSVKIDRRAFAVQRLHLPEKMVDLDPETERRAVSEGERLRTLYRTITGDRLWKGAFVRPVQGTEPGSGFGSRRVINGRPKMPHSGLDFAAARGTPVVATNSGRVVLVADYFFPGRLVAIDHGLGLYTLYFHLADAPVTAGDAVERGQPIGTVGATGRATGPHLHFGVQVGPARVDPAGLLRLGFRD